MENIVTLITLIIASIALGWWAEWDEATSHYGESSFLLPLFFGLVFCSTLIFAGLMLRDWIVALF